MKEIATILTLVVATASAGCTSNLSGPVQSSDVSPWIKMRHGRHFLDLLKPEKVVAIRVHPIGANYVGPGKQGYQVVGVSRSLTERQKRRLQGLIFDLRGYHQLRVTMKEAETGWRDLWGSGCGGFQPAIVFRFQRIDNTVDIVICFKCQEWRFEADGKSYTSDVFSGAPSASIPGFDGELEQLAADVFLQDIALQYLAKRLHGIDKELGSILYQSQNLDARTVPALILGLGHEPWVEHHDTFAKALATLTKESFGQDQRRWIEWWDRQGEAKREKLHRMMSNLKSYHR